MSTKVSHHAAFPVGILTLTVRMLVLFKRPLSWLTEDRIFHSNNSIVSTTAHTLNIISHLHAAATHSACSAQALLFVALTFYLLKTLLAISLNNFDREYYSAYPEHFVSPRRSY